jgi:hypothetical protein
LTIKVGKNIPIAIVRFGCLFTRKPGLGYSRGANYSQAGGVVA